MMDDDDSTIRLGHIEIPSDIGLPGTSAALLTIFCEESLPTPALRVAARDADGKTVLHLACIKCCPPVFIDELLQMGADINSVDYAGNSALHLACETRAHEHTLLLLQRGADVSVRNGEGQLADLGFLRGDLPHKAQQQQLDSLLEQEAVTPSTQRHLLFSKSAALLAKEQKTLFSGDSALLAAAARVAKFQCSVPLGAAGEGQRKSPSNPNNNNNNNGDDEDDDDDLLGQTSASVEAGECWPEPPLKGAPSCWFNVIPRVPLQGAYSFLVGGMVRFGSEFQFDGLGFHLGDSVLLPDENIEVTRFTSMQAAVGAGSFRFQQQQPQQAMTTTSKRKKSSQFGAASESAPSPPPVPPVVLELISCATDVNLPTVVRVFRDVSGSVASLQQQQQQQQRALEEEQKNETSDDSNNNGGKKKKLELNLKKKHKNEDDEEANAMMMDTKFRLRSLQMQAEGRACQVIRRSLSQYRSTTRFRTAMFTTLDRILLVKSFLRKAVNATKFCEGVLFFATASFLRYAYAELGRFPSVIEAELHPHRHHGGESQFYVSLRETVTKILSIVEEEKFVSGSLMWRSVALAFRRRQRRLFEMSRMIKRHGPPTTTRDAAASSPTAAPAQQTGGGGITSSPSSANFLATNSPWRLLPRRERIVWCLSLDEVISALLDNLTHRELLPVIGVAQLRDGCGGFLPRSLMFSLKREADPFAAFCEAARSKAKRTLMDMTSCFRGRNNYHDYVLQKATAMNKVLNESELENEKAHMSTLRGKHQALASGARAASPVSRPMTAAMAATANYDVPKRGGFDDEGPPDRADPAKLAHFIHNSPFRQHMLAAPRSAIDDLM